MINERADNRPTVQEKARLPVAAARTLLTVVMAPAAVEGAQTIYDLLVPDSHLITMVSAEPNLVEICRNVKIDVTVRDFQEINGKVGYQEGEDKAGDPIKGAKVQWKVNGKDVGQPMTTNDKGVVEKRFDAQPCNDDGKSFKAQAEITTQDGRTTLRTFTARNGYTKSSNAFIEKSGSAVAGRSAEGGAGINNWFAGLTNNIGDKLGYLPWLIPLAALGFDRPGHVRTRLWNTAAWPVRQFRHQQALAAGGPIPIVPPPRPWSA